MTWPGASKERWGRVWPSNGHHLTQYAWMITVQFYLTSMMTNQNYVSVPEHFDYSIQIIYIYIYCVLTLGLPIEVSKIQAKYWFVERQADESSDSTTLHRTYTKYKTMKHAWIIVKKAGINLFVGIAGTIFPN